MKFSVQCVRSQGARLGVLTEVGLQKNKTLETPMCMLYTRGGDRSSWYKYEPKMKFSIQCVRNQGARLGVLTEVGLQKNKSLETPMCMLYTRGGSCPHLTADMMKKIKGVPVMAQMPINLLVQYQEVIAGYKLGMAKFSALDNQLVYTSIHDPATEVPTGYNDKHSVGVWAKRGKIKVDVEEFMKIQEAILPDWFQCLTDCDTNTETKQKRAIKSVERTLNFLDSILERKRNSERLKGSCIFGSIVGGYSVKEREKSARETVARNVDGFTLDGFFQVGPNTENFDVLSIKEVIDKIMCILPEDKPRLMSCVWRPDQVLHAVEMGIDIFDSSYPYVLTERGCALTFDYSYQGNPESENKTLQDDFYIDLNDKIHNFHHYFRFFASIRQALQDDKFDELKTLILKQKPVQDVNKPL